MVKHFWFIACSCLVIFFSSPSYPVSIDFTATVTDVSSVLANSSDLLGQTGIGHIAYNMNPDDTLVYGNGTTYNYNFPNATYSFELPNAGMTFTAGSSRSNSISGNLFLDVSVDITDDKFSPTRDRMRFFGNGISQTLEGFDTRMFLGFFDSTATSLTDESLSNILNPLLYDTSYFSIFTGFDDGSSAPGLSFSLDNVVVSNVPIPSTILFFVSALFGLVGMTRFNKTI